MTDQEKARLQELKDKCLKRNGKPRKDADADDLMTLLALEAMAEREGTPQDGPENPEPEPEPEPIRSVDLTRIPTIAHRHVQAGCEYCGADKDGVHILHNEMGYHRVAMDGIQLDLLGDGLSAEYLEGLKK